MRSRAASGRSRRALAARSSRSSRRSRSSLTVERRALDLGGSALAAPGVRARGRRPAADARRALRRRVLLVRAGEQADPAPAPAPLLTASAHALLDGGDRARGSATTTTRPSSRRRRPGRARRAGQRATARARSHCHRERVPRRTDRLRRAADGARAHSDHDPMQRIRVLAALTSNVSLNAARTIAARTTATSRDLIMHPGRARDRRVRRSRSCWRGRSSLRRGARPRTSAASYVLDRPRTRPRDAGCRYVEHVGHERARARRGGAARRRLLEFRARGRSRCRPWSAQRPASRSS